MEKEAIKREINDIEFALATCDHITGGMQADAEDRLELLQQMLDNPCGKPHNNGEDTCNECEVIKEGI